MSSPVAKSRASSFRTTRGPGDVLLCKGARHFKTCAAEFAAVRFREEIFLREMIEQHVEQRAAYADDEQRISPAKCLLAPDAIDSAGRGREDEAQPGHE